MYNFSDAEENENFEGGDEEIDYDELMKPANSKAKPKGNKKGEDIAEFDIKSLGIDNMDADVDENVELTEADLRDPNLLAELQDLGFIFFVSNS